MQQLHHDVRRPVRELTDIHHVTHVLTPQLRAGACLAQQPLGDIGLADDVVVEKLQCNRLRELQVCRHHDHAHATLPQYALDTELVRDDQPRLHQVTIAPV